MRKRGFAKAENIGLFKEQDASTPTADECCLHTKATQSAKDALWKLHGREATAILLNRNPTRPLHKERMREYLHGQCSVFDARPVAHVLTELVVSKAQQP